MTGAPRDAIDLGAASRYLDALAGATGAAYTFQWFDDAKAGRIAAGYAHGTLAELADRLADLNGRGAGIFVMVNEGDGRGRSASNVRALRALFVDEDATTIGPMRDDALRALPFATLGARSVGGRHRYWRLRPGEPLDAFAAAQKRLARFLGTDPKIHDLPRVMRVPGFLHNKGEPRPVTYDAMFDRSYTIAEVLARVPDEAPTLPLSAPMPIADSLASSLGEPVERDEAPARTMITDPRFDAPAWHAGAVAGKLEDVRNAPAGERNNALNAKLYHALRHAPEAAGELAEGFATAARDAGLAEAEIRSTIRSAVRKGIHATEAAPVLLDAAADARLLRAGPPAHVAIAIGARAYEAASGRTADGSVLVGLVARQSARTLAERIPPGSRVDVLAFTDAAGIAGSGAMVQALAKRIAAGDVTVTLSPGLFPTMGADGWLAVTLADADAKERTTINPVAVRAMLAARRSAR